MKKSLVLLTNMIKGEPDFLVYAALSSASEVVLMQNGVYVNEEMAKAGLGSDFDKDKWRALDVDVEARRITSDFELIGYSGLVDAIEKNDNVITL